MVHLKITYCSSSCLNCHGCQQSVGAWLFMTKYRYVGFGAQGFHVAFRLRFVEDGAQQGCPACKG